MQLYLFSQRWRERRESYRPAGEPINPRLYEVADLAGDREAKAFILAHHYSACLWEGSQVRQGYPERPPWRIWPHSRNQQFEGDWWAARLSFRPGKDML
jgi:hypothetical protein